MKINFLGIFKFICVAFAMAFVIDTLVIDTVSVPQSHPSVSVQQHHNIAPPVTLKAQADTGIYAASDIVEAGTLWGILKANWGKFLLILLLLVEYFVRATPTERDNSIFNWVKKILDLLIPNLKKGGTSHL